MPANWTELIEPLAKRYELGAALGYDVRMEPATAKANAQLLRCMAAKLDFAVEVIEQAQSENPVTIGPLQLIAIQLDPGT